METEYQQTQYILVFTNYCCQILYISFLLKIETEKAKLDPKISLFLKILSLDFFHSFHDKLDFSSYMMFSKSVC